LDGPNQNVENIIKNFNAADAANIIKNRGNEIIKNYDVFYLLTKQIIMELTFLVIYKIVPIHLHGTLGTYWEMAND